MKLPIKPLGLFSVSLAFMILAWNHARGPGQDASAQSGAPVVRTNGISHRAQAMEQVLVAIGCKRDRSSDGVSGSDDDTQFDATANHFSLSVRAEDTRLPIELSKQLRIATRRAYEQWRHWLEREEIIGAPINMRIVGDANRFAALYGRPETNDFTPIGFYRISNNEAFVLYTEPFIDNASETAFHELSHLITAQQLGPTPPWLNEGIAEHFETLRIRDDRTEFSRNREHLQLLYRRGLVPLEELVGLSRRDWTEEDAPRRYASAWALIAFLQSSPEGDETLQAVIQGAFDSRCDLFFEPRHLLERYPGGTVNLEKDWQRWLSNQFGRVS